MCMFICRGVPVVAVKAEAWSSGKKLCFGDAFVYRNLYRASKLQIIKPFFTTAMFNFLRVLLEF